MVYFENTQDPQRVRIMRETPNSGAVPTPTVVYSAGTNIDITANVISVTGLTNYSAGTGIDIQDGVISATGATPVGYSAGTNIDITEGVISVTGINTSDFVTSGDVKTQIEAYNYATEGDVTAATSGCQETLVSGQNIKTINGESILGSGNLVIAGGQAVSGGDNIEVTEQGVINVTGITSYPGYSAISGDVQSQVVGATTGLQETLVSGENIKTINGESILGSGNITITGGSGTIFTAGDNIDISDQNVIAVTGVTSYPGYSAISGDVATQINDAVSGITSFPGYSAISGDVASQVEGYGYAQSTGLTTINSYSLTGNKIRIRSTDTRISITNQPSTNPVANDIRLSLNNVPTTGDIATQIEGYGYVTSGDVKTQIEDYKYVTSGDVATQVENYNYITGITSNDVTTALGYTPVSGGSANSIWIGTAAQYADLTHKSSSTLYFIV